MGMLQGFLEGGMAAIVAGCSTHPFDLIKVRLQLQGESAMPMPSSRAALNPAFALAGPPSLHRPSPRLYGPLSIAARIVQTEGPAALFSGVSATVLRQGVYSSTCLGIYQILTRHWNSPDHRAPAIQKIASGLVAGAIGAAVGNPADVALVRMLADGRLPPHLRRNYRGVGDALARIVRQEGVFSLWRGSSLTVQRAMVVAASQLATYDQVKEGLIHRQRMRDGVVVHVMSSCIAGLMAALTSNPVDVVKTRIMNMRTDQGRLPLYKGALDCVIKTVKAEGVLALYKGFVPTVMRQGPYTIVLFVTLEQIRKLFGHS